MLVNKEPAILFPIVIAMEVCVFFFVGAHVLGKIGGMLTYSATILQIMLLISWAYIILKHLKNNFFVTFWIPVIGLLLALNIGILVRLANGIFYNF